MTSRALNTSTALDTQDDIQDTGDNQLIIGTENNDTLRVSETNDATLPFEEQHNVKNLMDGSSTSLLPLQTTSTGETSSLDMTTPPGL